MKTVYPKDAETVSHHDYVLQREVPSKFRANSTTTVEFGTECPTCGNHNPKMEHGDYYKCPVCKLKMQLFGNGLHIWR